jgi:hypothetical protein
MFDGNPLDSSKELGHDPLARDRRATPGFVSHGRNWPCALPSCATTKSRGKWLERLVRRSRVFGTCWLQLPGGLGTRHRFHKTAAQSRRSLHDLVLTRPPAARAIKRHACNRQSGHRRRNAVAIPAVAAQGLATRVVASPAFRAPGGEQKSCHPRRDAWFSSRAQETLVFALSRRDERGQPWPPIVAAGARHLVRSIRERGVGRSSCCRSGRPSPAAYLLGA